jgi:hypothetical protein
VHARQRLDCKYGTPLDDEANPVTHLVLLLTVSCAVFANSIDNDFIWDDVALIKTNPLIRDLRNLPKLATTH